MTYYNRPMFILLDLQRYVSSEKIVYVKRKSLDMRITSLCFGLHLHAFHFMTIRTAERSQHMSKSNLRMLKKTQLGIIFHVNRKSTELFAICCECQSRASSDVRSSCRSCDQSLLTRIQTDPVAPQKHPGLGFVALLAQRCFNEQTNTKMIRIGNG